MRKRISGLGGRADIARAPGANVVTVRVGGLNDSTDVIHVLTSRGRLDLYDLEADLVTPSIDRRGLPVAHAMPLHARRATALLTCRRQEIVCPGVGLPPTRTYYYLVKHSAGVPELTNADLNPRGALQDFDPVTNEPIVLVQFTQQGRRKFQYVTRAESRRGKTRGTLQHFAIVLDNEIRAFPSIDFHQYPSGIDPSNGAQITGLPSAREARDLAVELSTGPLPLKFVLVRSGRL